MKTAYPSISPYQTHALKVGSPHTLYVEECGNPEGLPVLFVHGGPGSGCTEADRRFFDSKVYRVILFDQRGCGRSTPIAAIENNTTPDLISDIEAIRTMLGIDRWVIFGGSWGSTLGLVYAQTYPDRVLGLILRGIFLARPEDIAWLYGGGAGNIFPEYWDEFTAFIPKSEHSNLPKAYYQRLISKDEKERAAAEQSWIMWEGRCASLLPNSKVIEMLNEPKFAMCFARISCHYVLQNCFLEKNQILNDVSKLQGIPGLIVHGRYDILCPDKMPPTLVTSPFSRIQRSLGHFTKRCLSFDTCSLRATTKHLATHKDQSPGVSVLFCRTQNVP